MDIETFKQHGLDQAWGDLHPQNYAVNGRSNAEILEVLDTLGDAQYHPCAGAIPRTTCLRVRWHALSGIKAQFM